MNDEPFFNVRRLMPADIDVMLKMSAMFAAAFDEAETYARPPRAAYLDRLLGNREFVALAVVRDDEVLGGLVAYELVKYRVRTKRILHL